jgi:hypothetical protein
MMEEWAQMVADCEARESRLTDWQREFIQSIGEQLRGGRALTQKQSDTLDSVWEEATRKG